MDKAELYSACSQLQRADAELVVRDYARLVGPFERGARVLDAGCGDGRVTKELLAERLPPGSFLTGGDVSAKMVEHAQSVHGSGHDENAEAVMLNFRVLDLAARALPEDAIGAYDHVFSFNCLHWIQDQRLALRNVHSLLRPAPGGDCLLSLIASNPIFDVYRALASSSAWSPYMGDVERFVSPYHDSTTPANDLKRALYACGFAKARVDCVERLYYYSDVEKMKKAVLAVCPFLPRMPQRLHADFFDDYTERVRRLGLFERGDDNNNPGDRVKIRVSYRSLVAHAVK